MILLCLFIVSAGVILLTAASLFLPPAWVDEGLTVTGILIGAMLALALYRVWGGASWLADASVWITAALVVFGAILLQRLGCGMLQSHVACSVNRQRANLWGIILSVLLTVLPVWLAIRYETRRLFSEQGHVED